MITQYYRIDRENPNMHILSRAATVLKQGGLVAFPTETVYGLGANGLNARAVAGIFRAKGRPADNPLILHIADNWEAEKLARRIPPKACALMERYWPGPLTVVLERSQAVPDIVTAGLDTVAVRLPASTVARSLIRLAGIPVAAPSANTSGRPSPTNAQNVLADLDGLIDMIIDDGSCNIGLESTVIDCTTPVPTLLRPGGITYEMLVDTIGEVEIDPALSGVIQAAPRSPGMKYTHYAPAAPMVLVQADYSDTAQILLREITKHQAQGKRVGAVVSNETAKRLPAGVYAAVYGSRLNLEEVAANLYVCLRRFDATPVDIIYAEGVPENGLGRAVMNRMRKAAGYRIISD